MELPRRSRYIVIGAGMHGLSTALHLARQLRTRGLGEGSDVVVLDKSTAGAGATGHRLRCRAQQLLPARHERADAGLRGGVGVRSRGLPLQRRRLHRARPRRAGARPRRRRRAAGADRLPLGADRRRGGRRRPHEAPLPRLARQGRHRLPARAPGRLRLQPRVGRRAAGQVPRGGRADSRAHRGDGLRARRRRRR